jgi:teichuronic acid exporter
MAFVIVITNLIYYLSWHYLTRMCIHIHLWDMVKDIAPYFIITLSIFALVYLITVSINNIYWNLSAKIGLSIILYVVTMIISKSAIFKEAKEFILERKVSNIH